MWINNTDKEIECFHPVCQEALQAALVMCQQEHRYEIQHHRRVGALEMDFVIANKNTNKIACVIEVKRSIAAVYSTRCQCQAMNYVQMLSKAELERPYYILTNLECSCLFRYDASRQNVYEQMLEPGITLCHTFQGIEKREFIDALARQYASYITTILSDGGNYFLSFSHFAFEIENSLKCSDAEWRHMTAAMFYEYIRGSLSAINRASLLPISRLHRMPNVCREASSINFKDIFNIDNNHQDAEINISTLLLNTLYDLGSRYVDADELAGVMHKVVSNGHEHEGEVPTDVELANMIMWILKNSGISLGANDCILDPAAGSGNLLSAACETFSDIQPKQLIANDINPRLLQLLSLRLGLKFAHTVTPQNSPTIYSRNIAELGEEAFENTKCIVMNPPFLAATDLSCLPRKEQMYKRITSLTRRTPKTKVGQMPLEGAFIELVTTLARQGTAIACVLPHTHLTGRGLASRAIRRFLLDDFGLQTVFNYPSEGLFSDVNQNTVVVVGIKGSHPGKVRFIYSQNKLSEINGRHIANIFGDNPNSAPDFEVLYKSIGDLSLADGWQFFNITRNRARQFVNDYLNPSPLLKELRYSEFNNYQRGKIQNLGGTDLLFPQSKPLIWDLLGNLCRGHLKSGMRNADYENLIVGNGDQLFLDVHGMDESTIHQIATLYAQVGESSKKQPTNAKTAEDFVHILKIESKHAVPPHTVLLPRGIRSKARVFVTDKTTFPTTNFFLFPTTPTKAKALAYWYASVFYQLENEIEGKNNRGMRKLEQINFNRLHVPNFNAMTAQQLSAICNTPFEGFLDLRNPIPRRIDYVWATILFGNDGVSRLDETVGMLSMLVADRES